MLMPSHHTQSTVLPKFLRAFRAELRSSWKVLHTTMHCCCMHVEEAFLGSPLSPSRHHCRLRLDVADCQLPRCNLRRSHWPCRHTFRRSCHGRFCRWVVGRVASARACKITWFALRCVFSSLFILTRQDDNKSGVWMHLVQRKLVVEWDHVLLEGFTRRVGSSVLLFSIEMSEWNFCKFSRHI